MYLKTGETIPLIDLVYGLMLTSGNDAAVAIACFLDGSTEAFAAHMNARAEKLGLTDTHFVTPNGLHDPDHYTTAKDLALLGAAALENPFFAEIVRTLSENFKTDFRLVATGGFAKWALKDSGMDFVIDPTLTLHGAGLIASMRL
jgi:D-alanyl-D-alanine carboxypeptidase